MHGGVQSFFIGFMCMLLDLLLNVLHRHDHYADREEFLVSIVFHEE